VFHLPLRLLATLVVLALPQAATTLGPNPKADQLHARALALHSKPGRYLEAARLHRAEAGLRAAGDPQAFECLKLAARLLVYANRVDDARIMMEQTGRGALARADSTLAARAFIEAAFIAVKQGRQRDARALVQRAKTLVDTLPEPPPILSHS
jgi:hypothetical protein